MDVSTNKAISNKKHTVDKPELVPSQVDTFTLRKFLRDKIRKMPHTLLNRIFMLKNLQVIFDRMKVDFYRERFDLERKYHEIHKDIYQARGQIISGEVDPSPEKPTWKDYIQDDENGVAKFDFAVSLSDLQKLPKEVRGIPDFWITIFRNCEPLSELIYEHDIPALKALRDIQIHYENHSTFTLVFHFDANRYFHNSFLTKKYFLKNAVGKYDRFANEGLEIYKCVGCKIFWREGMNLNMCTVRVKGLGRNSTLMKEIPQNTFFKYFTKFHVETHSFHVVNEETHEESRADFEIAHFLREQIIPRAVLYYTGDINDDAGEGYETFEADK